MTLSHANVHVEEGQFVLQCDRFSFVSLSAHDDIMLSV